MSSRVRVSTRRGSPRHGRKGEGKRPQAPTREGKLPSAVCWSSKVSLSDDLRNELAAIAPAKTCDRLAELSGLFHAAGSIHLRGRGNVSVHLDVGASAVARRGFSLLRTFGVGSEIRTYRSRSVDR